jgi:ATPase subunit of ABC transporter with duplicated ATPase domains
MALIFDHVGFAYDGSPRQTVCGLTAHFPPGWTGVVGANGIGKTTVLQLACGLLAPTEGLVRGNGLATYCPQRTDAAPAILAGLVDDYSPQAIVLRRGLGIGDGWAGRWQSLSHGERKRAQLATALWQRPDVLAIDEPTNHLDEEARRAVGEALRVFAGVGILVSHDRALLDRLCHQCLFLEQGAATMRPGGYSTGSQRRADDQQAARTGREQAAAEFKRLRRVQVSRRAEADRAKARRSARGLARHDSDGRARRQAAIVSGKDGQAGRLLSQLEGRLQQARQHLATMPAEKAERAGIWLSGARSARKSVVNLPANSISVGAMRRLIYPHLTLGPGDRVALTGPNGAGKTTLLVHLLGRLTLPSERVVYVPQEVTAEQCSSLLAEIKSSDEATLGRLLTVVSRLGSRPERVLESKVPSPGETRKLMLAMGVLREPHIVIMDEPTNHLDLPAIECLEEALSDTPCALLLVSHDRRFLGRLCAIEWRLEPTVEETRLRVTAMEGTDLDRLGERLLET